ncbi:MAG: 3-isopropylmalate dehydratase small subunit [Methylococcaceae bacterium TMED69]|nr:MAG: 3-isopropylmalate dehydratase small subunit [Methylococcaceae bacterium TMED69]|tara:strand:- start:487 stop:1125 length:639 start_codon:yes stop_codon:yes gene_type:complete
MEKFTQISGKVAPLDRPNVDTDAIIPKQFLKSIKKTGFQEYLFDEWRFKDKGFPGKNFNDRQPNENFILNQSKYKGANILLCRENFGCGSSREHAPWAIRDFGFKVLIAPSFADIFFNNSVKNGLLLIILDEESIQELFQLATLDDPLGATVNLDDQTVETSSRNTYRFSIEPSIKQRLIDGADDISLTLQYKGDILNYEQFSQKKNPWRFS